VLVGLKKKNNNNNNNNTITNNHDSVYGAVVTAKVIARVHSVYLMNSNRALGGRQPQTKPIDWDLLSPL